MPMNRIFGVIKRCYAVMKFSNTHIVCSVMLVLRIQSPFLQDQTLCENLIQLPFPLGNVASHGYDFTWSSLTSSARLENPYKL